MIVFYVRESKLNVIELLGLMKLKVAHVNLLMKADHTKINKVYHVKFSV